MNPELRAQAANRITLIGFFTNLMLLIFKFLAGFLGNSQAMIADAVHTLTDFATDVLVFVGVRWGKKPRDEDHPWGHGKYETVTAALIALTLALVGVGIGWEGIRRIIEVISTGTLPPRPDAIAFWASVISIVSKEILYRATVVVGRKINSPAVVANAWHHRSDALSSIGTAVGIGAAVFLGEAWTILDPLAAVVVSFFIIKVGFDILKQSLGDLTEKTLSREQLDEINQLLTSQPGVTDPHNLRVRMVGTALVLEVHVRMDGRQSLREAHDISRKLEAQLKERFGDGLLATIHMEPVRE